MRKLPTIPLRAAARPSPEIIAMLGDVSIAAAEGGETKSGPRRFDVLAYTGGQLVVAGYDLPVVVDLKGLSARKTIVANLDHDRKQRVGHVTARHNDGRSLRLEGLASAATAARDEVIASADDGFTWQASIEAAPQKLVKVASGKRVEVNGQSFEGPLLVARKSVLGGFAFLSHGADENTSVTIAASAAAQKEMPMELAQWIEALGFEADELTDKQKAALQAKFDAEIKAAQKKDDPPQAPLPEFDSDEIKAAASDHLTNLEAVFAQHEGEVKADKFAEIRAAASKDARELKVKALKERWLLPRYEAELIRASAKVELALVRAERPKGPAIHAARNDVSAAVIEAALCQSVGLPQIDERFSDEQLQAAHTAFRGRLGLQQTIIMAAEVNGYPRRDYRIDQDNLRDILKYAFAPEIRAGSTFSLSGILSSVANKELLAGYLEEDQSWREIAAVKPVSDFKAVTSYRMLDNMEYEELSPEGRIAHGQIGEESYTRQAQTYAKMFALQRTDIINDDLSAFDDLRTRLGRGSSRKFNNLFWARFLDNAAFFTAARGNFISGATTNLGTDGVGLELGIKAFRLLKTGEGTTGKRVGGQPTLLLVPPELEFSAQRLHQSTNVVAAGGGSGATIPDSNIHAGKYRPVVVPWLSDPNFAGFSATAWYLFRPLTVLAAIVVSFLNGVQTPTVESADADFDMLGIQFRGYHDFGVDLAEFLAGIKSKGAA
jgi:phage major head subunit gpT-like protein